MDLPDILKIAIFKDFLKIEEKKDPTRNIYMFPFGNPREPYCLSIPFGGIGYPIPWLGWMSEVMLEFVIRNLVLGWYEAGTRLVLSLF